MFRRFMTFRIKQISPFYSNFKYIGILSFLLGMVSGIVGTLFSILMRLELSQTGGVTLGGNYQFFILTLVAYGLISAYLLRFALLRPSKPVQLKCYAAKPTALFTLQTRPFSTSAQPLGQQGAFVTLCVLLQTGTLAGFGYLIVVQQQAQGVLLSELSSKMQVLEKVISFVPTEVLSQPVAVPVSFPLELTIGTLGVVLLGAAALFFLRRDVLNELGRIKDTTVFPEGIDNLSQQIDVCTDALIKQLRDTSVGIMDCTASVGANTVSLTHVQVAQLLEEAQTVLLSQIDAKAFEVVNALSSSALPGVTIV